MKIIQPSGVAGTAETTEAGVNIFSDGYVPTSFSEKFGRPLDGFEMNDITGRGVNTDFIHLFYHGSFLIRQKNFGVSGDNLPPVLLLSHQCDD